MVSPRKGRWKSQGGEIGGGRGENVLTLIVARNALNELSCLTMLWTARNRWPSGARFSLNCYCHEVLLVIQHLAALFHIITIIWGVTHEDPILMVIFVLYLLTLVKAMNEADPGCFIHGTQTTRP